jgi:hypothetical protein
MSLISTLSLTGKQIYNPLSLNGKSQISIKSISSYHNTKIKTIIFDRYITPILGKNWKLLKENMFQIDDIIKRLDIYYTTTNEESLVVYKYILQVIKGTIDTEEELSSLEEKLFDNGKDIAKITLKIPRIRLKPEMELYNIILGKPDKNLYDKKILSFILELLKTEYISFKEIAEKINIYNNNK